MKETQEECLRRESLEETGYRLEELQYAIAAEEYLLHEKKGYYHRIQYYYQGSICEKVQEPIELDHVFEWIKIQDLENKMALKIQQWAVMHVLQGLKTE